jgi:hypothetical protein
MSRIEFSFTPGDILYQTCMTKYELNLTIDMRYTHGNNATPHIIADIKSSCNYIRNRCFNEELPTCGCPHPCTHNRSCYSCWEDAIEAFVLTGEDVPNL